MLRSSPSATDDSGSAALEFIVTGLILLVPLVYLVIALGSIQEQALGAEAAARHTARAIGQADDAASAAARAESVLASVIDEYGMNPAATSFSLQCRPAATPCPAPGATVIVVVSTRVALPFMPPILGLDQSSAIPVEAAAAQNVSRLWGQ